MERLLIVSGIPMDPRHNSKIDYWRRVAGLPRLTIREVALETGGP